MFVQISALTIALRMRFIIKRRDPLMFALIRYLVLSLPEGVAITSWQSWRNATPNFDQVKSAANVWQVTIVASDLPCKYLITLFAIPG